VSLIHQLESWCRGIRHLPGLKAAAPLWSALRPAYEGVLARFAGRGLLRNMNGTDKILLHPECRVLGENYEPEIWAKAMEFVQPGARVLDIGAHWGLYALAFGHRVGPTGRVLAAEPDPRNAAMLRRNIKLNGLEAVVEVVPKGMSDSPGSARMNSHSLQSQVSADGNVEIALTTLDETVGDQRFDLMVLDVEGHEEKVLKGGRQLLSDPQRRPRAIVMEVHPYAWGELGLSSESLLAELNGLGYTVTGIAGEPVHHIPVYGHILALAEQPANAVG
jgi:FkbM family methyltransferase